MLLASGGCSSEGGELEGSDPALGAFLEGVDVLGRQRQAGGSGQVVGRLGSVEAEVGGAQLGEFPAGP